MDHMATRTTAVQGGEKASPAQVQRGFRGEMGLELRAPLRNEWNEL